MNEKLILAERENGILTITMNRPDKLNSLHPDLIYQLVDALHKGDKDPEVKVIVLTGAGKAFCAGGDLPYLESLNDFASAYKYIEDAGNIVSTIVNMDKPVIAMVNGAAAGAGFNIVLACDIIFCAESAKFAQSFANVGLIPDCGGTYLLPKAIGLHKAKELMFTCELITASQAMELGFINYLAKDEELKDKTYEFANRLANQPPLAVKFIKKAVNESQNMTLDNALKHEASVQTLLIQTEDSKEGIAAFKEKRRPKFTGK